MKIENQKDFAVEARTGKNANLARELFDLLRENKKWWLAPIVLTILLLSGLVVLGGSGAAPFIYTLF